MFIAALFPVAKTWKQHQWMNKEDLGHMYNEILVIKKHEIMTFAGIWMDLEIIILNEVSQKEKDKYPVISLTCEDVTACRHAPVLQGFPGGTSGKEPACQCRRPKTHRLDSWVGKMPCRRAQPPTPVFLPGESHEQRSLAGYGP